MSERTAPDSPTECDTALRPRLSKNELLELIQTLRPVHDRPAFVAISGFGGTGKSTLAESLRTSLEDASVIPIDDFIIGERTQRSTDWATFDRGRLRHDVLDVASIGRPLSYQRYNSGEWAEGRGGTWREVEIGQFVIIEGCGVIHPSLTQYYDASAWIDCTHESALESAKKRDQSEVELFGNDDTDRLWDEVWGPNDLDFFKAFRPDVLATVLVEPQFKLTKFSN